MSGTPEIRVTTAMVNAAWSKGKDLRMTGLPTDFRQVLEAAIAAPAPEPVADIVRAAPQFHGDPGGARVQFRRKLPVGTKLYASPPAPVAASAVDDPDDAYELGKEDGYSEAVQQIDRLTGGDGEYRYCTDHDPDHHVPDVQTMIERILARFAATPSSPNPVADNPAGEMIVNAPRVTALDWNEADLDSVGFDRFWQAETPFGPFRIGHCDGQYFTWFGSGGRDAVAHYTLTDAAHAQQKAYERRVLACLEPGHRLAADCYSNDDGDTWLDCPDDADFVDGLKVGDEYTLLASVRGWKETFRVVKAPDEEDDDYKVEPLPPPPAVEGSR